MKLNNKGIAISGILYSLLVLFIALLFGIMTILTSSKFTFDKLKNDIVNELNSNIISDIDISSGIPDVFEPGMAAYYDPVLGVACSKSEAELNVGENGSPTGVTTGCMKWYVIEESNEYKSTLNLILDHNTTVSNKYYNNADGVDQIPIELEKLEAESKWIVTPRIITSDEIAYITGADDQIYWNSNKFYADCPVIGGEVSNYYFDGSNGLDLLWQTPVADATNKSKYAWLYDRTSPTCVQYGCVNNADSSMTSIGYWTSDITAGYTTIAWAVENTGSLSGNFVDSNYEGIRPVITIHKSLIA